MVWKGSLTSGFRNPHHGMFRAGVGGFPRKRDDGVGGAEIHNAAASERARGVAAGVGARFLQEHGARDGAVAEERATHVGVEDVVEFGEGGGCRGGRACWCQSGGRGKLGFFWESVTYTSAVHVIIYTAEFFDSCINHLLHALLVCHVDVYREDATGWVGGVGFTFLRGGSGGGEREVCEEDAGGAGFGEGETGVFADAAAGLGG